MFGFAIQCRRKGTSQDIARVESNSEFSPGEVPHGAQIALIPKVLGRVRALYPLLHQPTPHCKPCPTSFLSTTPPIANPPAASNGRLRHLFPLRPLPEWTPLGRGSDGRFGLRRFRAKLTPNPFGTHRAFTHALPPSSGLRSVPFTVPPCFFPLPLK
jgi:hypothetical protein